jgi:hypothetical protein
MYGVNWLSNYVERAANLAGSATSACYMNPLPLSAITALRHQAGVIQLVAGAAIVLVAKTILYMEFVTGGENFHVCNEWSRFGANQVLHGITNIAIAAITTYALSLLFTPYYLPAMVVLSAAYGAGVTRPVFDYLVIQDLDDDDLKDVPTFMEAATQWA